MHKDSNSGRLQERRLRSYIRMFLLHFSILMAIPFILSYSIKKAFIGQSRSFSGTSQFLSLFPGLSGQLLRRGFYYITLKQCSSLSTIDFGTFFPSNEIVIKDNVYIGANCIIAPCVICNDVLIGSGVHIVSKNAHVFDKIDSPIRLQGGNWEPVLVEEGSWIGNRAIVMSDIGKHCVIGAGSVVTKSIEEYSVAVGAPACVIMKRR